jgi:cobalamin synthase
MTLTTQIGNIAKGLLAICFWIVLSMFVLWLKTPSGYWIYLVAIAPSAVVILGLAMAIKPSLKYQIPNGLGWIFNIYQEKMEWVAFFILVLFYGAALYFVFFAPYGMLCHLNLKPCGEW